MDRIGKSYVVHAPSREYAPGAARLLHRNPKAVVLHCERIEPGVYEVVVQVGTQRSVS